MEFNQEVKLATDPIYKKISKVMPEIELSFIYCVALCGHAEIGRQARLRAVWA